MGIIYVLWSWLTFSLPVQQQMLEQVQQPTESVIALAEKAQKTGIASYYHEKFEGRKTATGDIFDNDNFTAASNFFKLGTFVKVTNLQNGKVVYVKINDRMGHSSRVIDLTVNAAKKLKFVNRGLTKVKIEQVPVQEAKRHIIAQSNMDATASATL